MIHSSPQILNQTWETFQMDCERECEIVTDCRCPWSVWNLTPSSECLIWRVKERMGDPSTDPEFPKKGFPKEELGLGNKLVVSDDMHLWKLRSKFLASARLMRANRLIC